MNLTLTGQTLTLDDLARVARDRAAVVSMDESAMAVVARSRQRMLQALESGERVYGLTTGLGSRVVETLSAAEAAQFSLDTLRGRAHATGDPLPAEDVRAAMVVRLNTLLKGAAGADPAMLQHLEAVINAGLVPVVGELGSIGAGDLCLGATMGLAILGEGEMILPDGRLLPATEVLRAANIPSWTPGPRDGLALANNSSFSAALMALAVDSAQTLSTTIQVAGALSLEAFGANLSPLDPATSRLRPQAGQFQAAEELARLLAGSVLEDPDNARRLQDPLSLRNLPQVHGAVLATLSTAAQAAVDEINGASDNPVVDLDGDRIMSCGAYHTPYLTVTAQALSQAWMQAAFAQLARLSKLVSNRFSDLPQYLAAEGNTANGFAPVMKIAESVVAEMGQAAMPVPIWPSINADGVEDIQTNSPATIRGLRRVIGLGFRLSAMELIVATRAQRLRGVATQAPCIAQAMDRITSVVPEQDGSTPLGGAIDRLALALSQGLLLDLP